MASEEAPSNELVVPPAPKSSPLAPPPPPLLPLSPDGMKRALGPLAIVAYLLTLPVLGFGVWLVSTDDYDCEDLLRAPNTRVAIGVGLLLVVVISNFVVYYGAKVLMPGHMVLSVVLVVMMTVGLSLVGMYKMEARSLPESPLWLRHRVMDVATWNDVKACLYDDMICQDLAYRTMQFTSDDFDMLKLSTIESGCCKPPDFCGMEYMGATHWKEAAQNDTKDSRLVDKNTTYASYIDCPIWNNEQDVLCYDCQSCKAAFLRVITSRWRKVGVFLIVMSVLFLVIHAIRFIALMLVRYKS